MTNNEDYVIDCKGWNYVADSLKAKKEKFDKMVMEMAVKYGVTEDEILDQLNK